MGEGAAAEDEVGMARAVEATASSVCGCVEEEEAEEEDGEEKTLSNFCHDSIFRPKVVFSIARRGP